MNCTGRMFGGMFMWAAIIHRPCFVLTDPDDGASWHLIYPHPRSSGTQYKPVDPCVGGSRPPRQRELWLGRQDMYEGCCTIHPMSVWTSLSIVATVNSDSFLLGKHPGPDRRQAIAVRFQLPALFQPAARYQLWLELLFLFLKDVESIAHV
ncbi:hypothetical protein EV127DRAFT_127359 [Xylaria flabelliformis]|nr:hypothetical protein EV127DRAFT_127359 [Xylaria flabelliformis]